MLHLGEGEGKRLVCGGQRKSFVRDRTNARADARQSVHSDRNVPAHLQLVPEATTKTTAPPTNHFCGSGGPATLDSRRTGGLHIDREPELGQSVSARSNNDRLAEWPDGEHIAQCRSLNGGHVRYNGGRLLRVRFQFNYGRSVFRHLCGNRCTRQLPAHGDLAAGVGVHCGTSFLFHVVLLKNVDDPHSQGLKGNA